MVFSCKEFLKDGSTSLSALGDGNEIFLACFVDDSAKPAKRCPRELLGETLPGVTGGVPSTNSFNSAIRVSSYHHKILNYLLVELQDSCQRNVCGVQYNRSKLQV